MLKQIWTQRCIEACKVSHKTVAPCMKIENNGEPADATTATDSCFGLFGPGQCGVAPGVDWQLLTISYNVFA